MKSKGLYKRNETLMMFCFIEVAIVKEEKNLVCRYSSIGRAIVSCAKGYRFDSR